MSVNDKNPMIGGARGTDVYPGVANPTARNTTSNPMASNFVEDPTSDDVGAGAPANFTGHEDARKALRNAAGVVESRPGIIESANIDPLNENSNAKDGWANASTGSGTGAGMTTDTAQGYASTAIGTASTMATTAAHTAVGGAKYAYGAAVGDQQTMQQGADQVNERGAGNMWKS